jgi:hypothetical protein
MMDSAPLTVTRAMTLDLIDASGAATPLEAKLRYESDDPYAISAEFSTGVETVGWVFARDLLASGLYEPAGDGDVHVWPCLDVRGRAVVIFELCSPDGEALLQARADEVADFLQSTRDLVPHGSEGAHVDLDELVTRLLADPV